MFSSTRSRNFSLESRYSPSFYFFWRKLLFAENSHKCDYFRWSKNCTLSLRPLTSVYRGDLGSKSLRDIHCKKIQKASKRPSKCPFMTYFIWKIVKPTRHMSHCTWLHLSVWDIRFFILSVMASLLKIFTDRTILYVREIRYGKTHVSYIFHIKKHSTAQILWLYFTFSTLNLSATASRLAWNCFKQSQM
jgi:hypothetical protein